VGIGERGKGWEKGRGRRWEKRGERMGGMGMGDVTGERESGKLFSGRKLLCTVRVLREISNRFRTLERLLTSWDKFQGLFPKSTALIWYIEFLLY
jgi:hypothetical protein